MRVLANGTDESHERLTYATLARRTAIAVALLMTFRIFQFFPGMEIVQEAWYGLCLLVLVTLYPAWKTVTGLRFSTFELYVVVLVLFDMLLPAWAAQREFGQPFAYEFLAQRIAFLFAVPLLIVNAMKSGRLQSRDVESALLFCVWATFCIFLPIRLFLNPADFMTNGVGFTRELNGKPVFNFNINFLIFGFIYYALLGIRKRRVRYYLAAAVLLMSAFTDTSGRALSLGLAGTLLFFLFRWRSFKQFLVAMWKFAWVALVLAGLAYVASPTSLASRATGFADAFAALTATSVQDPSANARIVETIAALPHIEAHPLVGNGELSSQWDGRVKAMGENFYPGDIGLIGAVFKFGLLGILVFAYQYLFALRASRKVTDRRRGALADAVAGFLVLGILLAPAQAPFALAPEMTLTFIAILIGLGAEGNEKFHDKLQPDASIHALSALRLAQSSSN